MIRNALVAATDEMVLALRKSAYSTNIKTRADFSVRASSTWSWRRRPGLHPAVHLGSMVEQVPRAILDYGPENLGPGDVIVTNDPYPSGVHLNDVTLVSPVYVDGEVLGYVANLAHHVDVGGGAAREHRRVPRGVPGGRDHPPVKIVEAGKIVPDVFKLILAQIRSKHETGGDFRAQMAANATGVRRLQAIVARHGRETVSDTMDELLAYTERRVRAGCAELPPAGTERRGRSTRRIHRRAGAARARRPVGAEGWRSTMAGATRSAARINSTRPDFSRARTR